MGPARAPETLRGLTSRHPEHLWGPTWERLAVVHLERPHRVPNPPKHAEGTRGPEQEKEEEQEQEEEEEEEERQGDLRSGRKGALHRCWRPPPYPGA